MSELGDAIGTAVEGGLVSRAVEPEHGEMGDEAERGACLNCDTALIGPHCHQCGQKGKLHRTIGAFMHDLLHGALHFEGKVWRTLPELFFRPGKLTRRYIEGERARFVSPMALFLFTIFLMFATFQFAGIGAPTDFDGIDTSEWRDRAGSELQSLAERRGEIETELAAGGLKEDERAMLRAERDQLDGQLAAIEEAERNIPFLEGLSDGMREPAEGRGRTLGQVPTTTREDGSTDIPFTVDSGSDWNINVEQGGWFEQGLGKWQKNPGLMLYKLQTNFYKFSWLLIPLSIPFVWVLFAWKRRFRGYDHAIFVTYSLSFMTLLVLVVTMMGTAGAHPLAIVLPLLLIPPIHLYKQLRGAYDLSRLSALWRLIVLSVFITVIVGLAIVALLFVGLF